MPEIWEDSEARKNFSNVFNQDTIESLFDLADDGYFDVLHGFVKDGKESKVAVAEKQHRDGENTFFAAKIYVIEASNYESMQQYLHGDPRFEGIKTNRRAIVHNWCTKEFKNLSKAADIGITAPEPVAYEDNVLLMEFLGEDFRPAPRLNEIELENPAYAFDVIVDVMERLWQDAELVHADLSPFNVLVWHQQLYTIDFSQAVLNHHPRAEEFLERDAVNVANHFRKQYGIDRDPAEIMDSIIG